MMASCFGVVNAQILVDENGKVGVGIETTDNLLSTLSVNSTGNSSSTVHIVPDNNTQNVGLYVNRTGVSSSGYQVAGQFFSSKIGSGLCSVGVYARASSSAIAGTGRSFGVMAYAGNASNGFNYGVLGVLNGTQNGAGVYGSTSAEENGINTGGRYAGFFHGNVYTTGTLTANAITTLSDSRVKRNIQSVTAHESPLDNLMDMNVVEYNYIDIEAEIASFSETPDTVSSVRAIQGNELSLNEDDKHYGLIAQELQKIYPNLVKEGRNGYLTINYIEMIPLLISSIQELNAKVEQYENAGASTFKAQARTTDVANMEAVVTTLYQNTPNPFTESTLIRCDVAEDVAKADLYIYNMNGEQIAEYAVSERGATSITIDGGSLNPGMYLYALIADGQVIDTKRMILTK
ncbi:MAG: tail fiber domain-containing protein [Bacteroidaceae bacterium]|nr:tail fiber domain-containing protein [Bacteroidaceae bacterium]